MAASDDKALDAELEELEAQERLISLQRRRIHDRLASFPNAATQEREREISRQRRELHAKIDALRAQRSSRRAGSAGADE
jgi:hypothetical protein